MEKSVGVACLSGWNQVTLKVNHAVVFVDTKVAEILHWVGGIETLLDAGADDVREFSSFESGSASQKKALFLVSSPLEGLTQQILQDVVSQSHFQYVVVMTTVHPLLHSKAPAISDVEKSPLFGDFEELIQEWMGNMNYTAEVLHVNLFSVEVSPGFFITPAFSELFPLLSSDLPQISYQHSIKKTKDATVPDNLNDLAMSHLPDGLQTEIRLFVSGLHGMLQAMGVKEDIYSLGGLSRIMATELDAFPPARARRKACQSRLSLILVDRTLDLASAVSRQTDVLLDKVVNTLPGLAGHHTDRHVDMTALCHCYGGKSKASRNLVLPGCLAPAKVKESPGHLTSCIMKKHKEALMDINRKLVETASSEKLPLDLSRISGRVTADLLDSTLALFKGKYHLIRRHLETLQVAMATSQMLKHPSSLHYDTVVAKEKTLLQAMADWEGNDNDDDEEEEDRSSSVYPSVFALLSKMLVSEMEKEADEREITLDDFLHLLVYAYSLSDETSENQDEIQLLQDRLVQAIIQEKGYLNPLVQAVVGEKVTDAILPDLVESVWDKMAALTEARRDLKEFGDRMDPGGAMSPASLKPLLRQVMERIVDPSKPELPDLECKSGGLKDLLKSGFGFFKSSAKPRPGDAPLLMVLVVGGVTASEVRQVKDIVSSAKPGFEVVVGGTRISNVESTLESLLVKDSINVNTTSTAFVS